MTPVVILSAGAPVADRLGDIPTWISGIGTVLAVIVALILAGSDGRRREKERRKRQAEQLTAFYEWDPPELGPVEDLKVTILNGSDQVAYRVIASLVPVRGTVPDNFRELEGRLPTDYRAFIGELPPGRTERRLAYPGGGGFIRFAVELAFRDASGRKWRRSPLGLLEEIKVEPADYYGLHEPLDW